MTITFDLVGRASFLDNQGDPMETVAGLRAVMVALGVSTARELGSLLGKQRRTVNNWMSGRGNPPMASMYVMQRELEKRTLNQR